MEIPTVAKTSITRVEANSKVLHSFAMTRAEPVTATPTSRLMYVIILVSDLTRGRLANDLFPAKQIEEPIASPTAASDPATISILHFEYFLWNQRLLPLDHPWKLSVENSVIHS